MAKVLLRLAAVVAVLAAARVNGLPDYLSHHGCVKGLDLVNHTAQYPAIMSAVPNVDPTLLALYDAPISWAPGGGGFFSFFAVERARPPPLERGDSVKRGGRLELVYNGTYAGHATHIAFVVDGGAIDNSIPCGSGAARMRCTTCGGADAWLKSAEWQVPQVPGPATAAIAVAHSGLGTPAVRLARFTINVL
mmetsp:Transcript_10491/g.26951  ORF Transcript_10491/g.26951 Transcript_10491/m.26951 type:complete len:192 (+) Transcript_10491:262-837(+)